MHFYSFCAHCYAFRIVNTKFLKAFHAIFSQQKDIIVFFLQTKQVCMQFYALKIRRTCAILFVKFDAFCLACVPFFLSYQTSK